MPLKRSNALLSASVPDFQNHISTGWHQKLVNWWELYIPDTFLMTFEFSFLSQTTSIPQLNLPVVRSTCNYLVIRWHPHNVDALLMTHNCHLSRCHCLYFPLVFRGFPHFNCHIRTARNKELAFARSKSYILDCKGVSLENGNALKSLLERQVNVDLPHSDLVIFTGCQY